MTVAWIVLGLFLTSANVLLSQPRFLTRKIVLPILMMDILYIIGAFVFSNAQWNTLSILLPASVYFVSWEDFFVYGITSFFVLLGGVRLLCMFQSPDDDNGSGGDDNDPDIPPPWDWDDFSHQLSQYSNEPTPA